MAIIQDAELFTCVLALARRVESLSAAEWAWEAVERLAPGSPAASHTECRFAAVARGAIFEADFPCAELLS